MLIKHFDNTVYVGIKTIIAPTAKNATSKNHPKDILCNENHLNRVILVQLESNIVFTTRKYFQDAGY